MHPLIVKDPENLLPAMTELAAQIQGFWNWETPIEITYRPARDRRSLDQNSLFWSLMEDIANHFSAKGYKLTKDQAHDLMCYKFLGTHDKVIGKTVIKDQMRRTSELQTGEMSDLITQIMDWAFDHGVAIRNHHTNEYNLRRKEHG